MDDWEKRAAAAESERSAEEDRWAWMVPRFAFRDSARTSGWLTVINAGPGSASNVTLDVWVELNGGRVEIEGVEGNLRLAADRLDPYESVHASVGFAVGTRRSISFDTE